MNKKLNQPYQPLLLRILHGITGLMAILALLTAFWTYNTYDGRWGKIPLPNFQEIEGIHGTFGLWTLLILPLFAIYAFHRGQRRLIQPDFLLKLRESNARLWWYNIHRFTNTLTILALTFAVFSGKMMDEKWLPNGELNHNWYYLHLISWVIMLLAISLHLLLGIKIGGLPLLASMLNLSFQVNDSPKSWPKNLKSWLKNWPILLKQEWSNLPNHFQILEIFILVSIIMAWIISLVK
jgi:hypothetical protein